MDKSPLSILSQWQSHLTNISSNLMELSEQMEFQIIKMKVKDTTNGYTGITKIKADQCVEGAQTLWGYYALLAEVIDEANKINNKRSFMYDAENALEEFLETTLIVVESEQVDINERNLLSGRNIEKKITPKALLKLMEDSFESLCRDINEITKAAETVESRLSNIKNEIARLNSTVKRLSITKFPTFDTDKVIEVESDPLKGELDLDNLVYKVEKYRATIQSVETDYNKIIETLNKVRDVLFELHELAEKSKIAHIESQDVFGIVHGTKPIIDEETLNSLHDWEQVLRNKLSEGYLNAVKIGVAKLESECFRRLEVERENYYINCKDYNEWLDLKGQFKALLAKGDMFKAKGLLLNNTMSELIEDARTALYIKPVKLDSCRQLIKKLDLNFRR